MPLKLNKIMEWQIFQPLLTCIKQETAQIDDDVCFYVVNTYKMERKEPLEDKMYEV